MATLRDIQQRIAGVKNTSKITQAMKMVSAAKLRRAQDAILSARPYVEKLDEVLSNLVASVGEGYDNPLISHRSEVKSIGVIVIAADRGLCGSFNTNVLKESESYIRNNLHDQYPDAKISIAAVGKRSAQYYKKKDYNVVLEFNDAFSPLSFDLVTEISNLFVNGYISGEYDKIVIYYNEFVNIVKQRPTLKGLLPIAAATKADGDTKMVADYIYEPNQKEILDVLLPKFINTLLWRTLLESNAAEQAARMLAMDNATNNAKDIIKELQREFNKKRQEAITKEMLEIVSGADALS